MLVKLRLGAQRMAGRARPGVASPACARWESAASGHPPVLSIPMGTMSKRVLPLPAWPGSAALDFELAERKHLYRRVPWCPLRLERSPERSAMPPQELVEAVDTAQGLANQM